MAPSKSLKDFPPEVLHQIFSHFHPSCTVAAVNDSSTKIKWDASDRRLPAAQEPPTFTCEKTDILNLTLVCRVFRAIAQPISIAHFHHHGKNNDVFQEGKNSLRRRLYRLIRTTLEQPRLREAVKVLDVDAALSWGTSTYAACFAPGGDDDYDAKLDRVQIISLMDAAADEEEKKKKQQEDEWGQESVEETFIQLLLCRLINLQDIRLVLPRHWRFRRLQGLVAPNEEGEYLAVVEEDEEGASAAGALGKVQRLDLRFGERWSDDVGACSMRHEECNTVCPAHPAEAFLVTATAPCVQVLSCTGSAFTSLKDQQKPPRFPELTHFGILMNGVLKDDAMFGQLLARDNLPKLTHLSFNSYNEHGPKPREVQRLLALHHKDKLEYFVCSMQRTMGEANVELEDGGMRWGLDDFEQPAQWSPPQDRAYVLDPTSLREDFPKLRILVLDDFNIWTDDEGFPIRQHSSSARPHGSLVDLLPPCIEAVVVNHTDNVRPSWTWPVARAMVANEAGGAVRFPRLRQVILYDAWYRSECHVTAVIDSRDATSQPGWPWEEVTEEENPQNEAWMRLNSHCLVDFDTVRAMRDACEDAYREMMHRRKAMFPDWTEYLANEVVYGKYGYSPASTDAGDDEE